MTINPRVLVLAEQACLIGPGSRSNDLYPAIERFANLVAADAVAAFLRAQSTPQPPAPPADHP